MPRPRAGLAAAAAALAICGAGCGEKDEPEPLGEPALELVAELEQPTHLAQPDGDERLYVTEREGVVRTISAGGEVGTGPFLDLRDRVSTEGEGGLLSIAFPPDHTRSGLLYVYYAGRDHRIHVDEYRRVADGETADSGSRRPVLSIPHPNLVHWGGLAAFGPDGLLYAGTGDGGPPFPIPKTSQDPDSPLGKILRIDPSRPGAEPKVVVSGVRNPWRFSFDRATGDLWIGDVGDFTEEEVDFLPARRIAGANLGWPALEGTAGTKSDLKPPPDAVAPVLTYERTGKPDDPFCAVTGGYVVRDPGLPSLEGRYLYGDFCDGRVRSLRGRARDDRPTGLEVERLVSFAEDASGRLYAISLEGPIYRIVEG